MYFGIFVAIVLIVTWLFQVYLLDTFYEQAKEREMKETADELSLYLEDGTLLWQSELVEPGAKSKPIVLTKTLEKGLYPNAFLRYSCYRMDETLAPLNGAETKLTLNVK